MPIAVDLVGYHGDAGLGLGSNPDINVPVGNLKVLDNTMRDMTLLANEKNMKLFQQKVNDRDQLEALILNNQTSTGEIDPKDQKFFDNDKALVEKAYDKWGGNFNDTDGFRKYQQAVTNLQSTATHAQTRWAGIKKLEQERSQQTLPSKIKAYDDWIEKQKSQPFGSQIVPFQQLHDFSINDIEKVPPPVKGTITNPNSIFQTETATVDYDSILNQKRSDYINDQDVADSIDKFTNQLSTRPTADLKKTVASMDAQIDKYNQERGFQQGQPGFVDHVKTHTADDGTLIIAEPKTDLAAKWALSRQPEFVKKTQKIDYKLLGAQLKEKDLAIKQKDLGRKWFDSNTKRMAVNLKKRQLDNADDNTKQFSQVWDNISSNIELPNLQAGATWATGAEGFKLDASKLPEGFQYVQGIDNKGQPIRLIPIGAEEIRDPKSKKIIGYQGGHYNTNYFVPSGTTINGTVIKKDINLSAKDLYDIYERSGYKGDFKDFVNDKFKNKEIDYQMEGQNGKANRVSSFISQMAMGNKATKKGQENPFSSDELDLLGVQEEPEQPDNQTPEPETQ